MLLLLLLLKWLGHLTAQAPRYALVSTTSAQYSCLHACFSSCHGAWQVCYGVIIVTFLGAVHWGMAMSSPLTSPIALKLANEAYVYSVIPSLVAWPVALMEPGERGHLYLIGVPWGVGVGGPSAASCPQHWHSLGVAHLLLQGHLLSIVPYKAVIVSCLRLTLVVLLDLFGQEGGRHLQQAGVRTWLPTRRQTQYNEPQVLHVVGELPLGMVVAPAWRAPICMSLRPTAALRSALVCRCWCSGALAAAAWLLPG